MTTFEKQYTNKDYADKAVEANANSQALYVYVHDVEYEEEVKDYEDVEAQAEQPVVDEDGNYVYNEDGTVKTETVTTTVQKVVMIEKTVQQEVPVLDENGMLTYNEDGTIITTTQETTVSVPSTHMETKTKTIGELVIADYNYYVCYEANYTDGTVNEDREATLVTERQTNFESQFFEITGYGWYRKTPKGYSSAVESMNTAFNAVTVMGSLPAGYLIFYTKPDFTDETQCTEEWLVANQVKNEAMIATEFATLYATFIQAWNDSTQGIVSV